MGFDATSPLDLTCPDVFLASETSSRHPPLSPFVICSQPGTPLPDDAISYPHSRSLARSLSPTPTHLAIVPVPSQGIESRTSDKEHASDETHWDQCFECCEGPEAEVGFAILMD